MKKSLLALAVLGAFAGAASAQSSVTIYGSIDGGVRHKSNVDAAGNNNTTLGSSGTYNSNRIGFKGVEDLGGGLNAHFNLENGFNSGTGAMAGQANELFNRGASVGLGGAWGSVDLGLQYSLAFKTIGTYDPFNYKYTGIVPLAGMAAGNQASAVAGSAGGTRFKNDIQYTANFAGLNVGAEYALGETAGSTSANAAQAVSAGYAFGPFSLGGAYTKRKPVVAAVERDNDQWTVGGAFTMDALRIAAGYIGEKQDSAAGDIKLKNAWLGGSYNFTPAFALTAAYYETKSEAPTLADGKRKLAVIGATYALSKRTNFYVDVDQAKFSGAFGGSGNVGAAYMAPAGQTKQTGVSVGINHLF
jgi:predicted porin